MRAFFQRPGIRRCRTVFRWCRITLWFIVLLLLGGIAYLHLVGLPDFIKQPLLRRMLADGIAARFSNVQLGWGPSVMVQDVAFSRSTEPLSPRLSASEAELAMDWKALLHLRLEARSLQVAGARLEFPVSTNNGDSLSLSNVALNLEFTTNDVARVNYCRGVFKGIRVDVLARANHASGIAQWKFPASGVKINRGYQPRLREVADVLESIQFTGSPILEIEAGADGDDMNSIHSEMKFGAIAVHTPWGNLANLRMDAACARLIESGSLPFMEVEWSAEGMDTPRTQARKISVSLIFVRSADSNFTAQIHCYADQFHAMIDAAKTQWLGASRLSWNGNAMLAYSNFVPLQANGKLQAEDADSTWGSSREISLECKAARAQNAAAPKASWGPWAAFAPWTFDCSADLTNVTREKLGVDHLAFAAKWQAPKIVVENLEGNLFGGQIEADAKLDIDTRELQASGKSDLNPQAIAPLLKAPIRKWLAQLDWKAPPKINAQVRVVLPPWTNQPADWASNMESSVHLTGDFALGAASFRHLPVDSARGAFAFTNRTWTLTRLRGAGVDGDFDLDYSSSADTLDYHFLFDSRVNPKIARPLLPAKQQRFFDEVIFNSPPVVHGEVSGCWRRPEDLGFAAEIKATNFVARGESVTNFSASVVYTNLILAARNISVSGPECRAQVPAAEANFNNKIITVTEGVGSLNGPFLKQIIGKKYPPFLDVVNFDLAPSISVSGYFSLTNLQDVGLNFAVDGQRLHYTNLMADRVSGKVEWVGSNVVLTNVVGTAYSNGIFNGLLIFDTRPGHGTEFLADLDCKDIDLSSLILGLSKKTNHIEGRLDGHLFLQGPKFPDKGAISGRGHVYVHNALLWDIKVFGLFSPILNAISPGWGHSRAREASANFVITNNAVASDNIVVRFTGFRLNLRGTVNKEKQINARLEATLSRDVPVLGPLMSLMFTPFSKLFEYRISGTLNDPQMEPIYIPRVVMLLLRPFHTLKTIAVPETPSSPPPPAKNTNPPTGTNSPPALK